MSVCLCTLRTPPFPPQIGGKYTNRFRFWRYFLNSNSDGSRPGLSWGGGGGVGGGLDLLALLAFFPSVISSFFAQNKGGGGSGPRAPPLDPSLSNIQPIIFAFRLIKNIPINPKLGVEFHQCHAKPHSICRVFTTISKRTKEIFAKIC